MKIAVMIAVLAMALMPTSAAPSRSIRLRELQA